MRTNRPEYLETFDYIGLHQYFLTFCTHDREHLFIEADPVELVRTQIARAGWTRASKLLRTASCPITFICSLRASETIPIAACSSPAQKQYSGFHYKAAHGRRLWQRYGYERVLRSEEAAVSVARYIIENPVRARLVACVADYQFSGSSVYTVEQLLDAVQLRSKWYSRSA